MTEMNVTLVLNDRNDMENLPKTMIDILNGMLKDHQCLSWRVHGMPDKVVMNIIWSNPSFTNPDFPQKSFTMSSTLRDNLHVGILYMVGVMVLLIFL